MDELKHIVDFDLEFMLRHLLTIMIAYLIALPIAWDREHETKSAGLRTFPLWPFQAVGSL